jgi:phosphoribosylformylglycinamidine synthase
MLVSVPREDDVRFQGLCEGRGYEFLRIGVTEDSGVLEVQDRFTIPIEELRRVHTSTMSDRFGAVIG